MKPFWRQAPLTLAEKILLELVRQAHIKSCARPNASRELFLAASEQSGSYVNGIIAALASLGGYHAPIAQTCWLLAHKDPLPVVNQIMAEGKRVPGWGNSFIKGGPDPLWAEVATHLANSFPVKFENIERITETLHGAGKKLYPNPSAYTAATALIVGLPAECAAWLFVSARLDGWTALRFGGTLNNQHSTPNAE